jgi:hypothetical protein
VFRASGVFWNPAEGAAAQATLDEISRGDGTTQTLMLGENIKAQWWGEVSSLWKSSPSGPVVDQQMSTQPARFLATIRHKGFGLSTEQFRNSGNAYVFPGTDYQVSPQTPQFLGFAAMSKITGLNGRCGSASIIAPVSRVVNAGDYLGLNSSHPGGVLVVFCDMRTHFLSDNIDPSLFARLVSSDGVRYGQMIHNDQY